jgi:hypothetical protein
MFASISLLFLLRKRQVLIVPPLLSVLVDLHE